MKIIITDSQLRKVISEQSKNFPIFNNTNQTATGNEKVIVDNINKWLSYMVNKNIDWKEKNAKKNELLGNFVSTKCPIFDEALKDLGLNDMYSNASDWYDSVIMQSLMESIQYKVGVKYFSLDGNNKISNIILG